MQRLALLLVMLAIPFPAAAWNRGEVEVFAVLPDGSSGPEGIEVGPGGKVYVTTFGFTSTGPATGEGQLYTFDAHGRLLRQVSIAGSTPHLLGLRFHPDGELLVIDFGGAQVLRVDPESGASSVFTTAPVVIKGASPGLNDLTFDSAGNVYVSDSFQGVIWKVPPTGGASSPWVESPLLRTTGIPPFGANGLRFDKSGANLFVANTGDDTIIRVPVLSDGTAGSPSVFTNSINGADGLIFDEQGNLWVAANQADEIVVVDPQGKAIAKLGDFDGISGSGSPIHMLFPASLRFHGDDLVVTNLSLNTHLFGFQTVDTDWSAQVSRYTVVKIRARIPKMGRGD